jgi:hypothetical protein
MTTDAKGATARYYTDEVGEWAAVLTVLIDRETQPYRLAKLRELRAAVHRMRAHGALVEALSRLVSSFESEVSTRRCSVVALGRLNAARAALASLTDEEPTDG